MQKEVENIRSVVDKEVFSNIGIKNKIISHHKLCESISENYYDYFISQENGEKGMNEPFKNCIRLTKQILAELPNNKGGILLKEVLNKIYKKLYNIELYFHVYNLSELRREINTLKPLIEEERILIE